MIREAGEEEEGRTAKPLDPAEAKKRRKKLKRLLTHFLATCVVRLIGGVMGQEGAKEVGMEAADGTDEAALHGSQRKVYWIPNDCTRRQCTSGYVHYSLFVSYHAVLTASLLLLELMHWFADPNGLKTKRDLVLEKKCHRLQRKAELRKTRERRIDYPDDTCMASSLSPNQ